MGRESVASAKRRQPPRGARVAASLSAGLGRSVGEPLGGSIRSPLDRRVRLLAWLAGASDASTGAALLAAPELMLRLLAVPPVAEPIFLRWIGAFVLAVGLAYLYPFALAASRRKARLRVVFEVTAIARAAVALTVGSAILAGALAAAWWGVALFDLALAAAQVALLASWDDGKGDTALAGRGRAR